MHQIKWICLAFAAQLAVPPTFCQTPVSMGTAIDSRTTGFLEPRNQGGSFAYGPSIVKDGEYYHMFFCSPGILDLSTGRAADGYEWDFIRHSVSRDGYSWTTPEITLKPAPKGVGSERSACDPSVVKFNGEWYMYYGGNADRFAGGMYVAKAKSLWDRFQKWTGNGWAENGTPKMILSPECPYGTCLPLADTNRYGAGQPTAIVKDGKIHLWFDDDSKLSDRTRYKYYVQSADGVNFTSRRLQNFRFTPQESFQPRPDLMGGDNGEVKWNPVSKKFVLFQQFRVNYDTGNYDRVLKLFESIDGISWTYVPYNSATGISDPRLAYNGTNLGVSGDPSGWLNPDSYWLSLMTNWEGCTGWCATQWNMVSISLGKVPMKKFPYAAVIGGAE